MSQAWKNDEQLEIDLKRYVAQNLKRSEIVDFMRRDYSDYEWSLRTLARRLNVFGIKYIDYNTPVEQVEEAVKKEVNGPGGLLGYRALNQKLRTE